MRPSAMTRMRSASPISSGISDEIRMTPMPLGRELVDQPIDLRLGADVDAAGRLVEDEQHRLARQPAREHHLLLVAAGEFRDLLVEARRLDRHLGGERRDDVHRPAPVEEAEASRSCRARTARRCRGCCETAAAPRACGPPARSRCRRRWRPAGCPAQRSTPFMATLPRAPPVEAEDGLGEFGAAGAHQPARCRRPRPCGRSG